MAAAACDLGKVGSGAQGRSGGDASVLVEGHKKAVEKRIRVMRRSRLDRVYKGPTGDERAPRNLYDLYV